MSEAFPPTLPKEFRHSFLHALEVFVFIEDAVSVAFGGNNLNGESQWFELVPNPENFGELEIQGAVASGTLSHESSTVGYVITYSNGDFTEYPSPNELNNFLQQFKEV